METKIIARQTKRYVTGLIIGAGVLVLSVLPTMLYWKINQSRFYGNRVSNTNEYSIDFTVMDQHDETVFYLEKGEALEVSYRIEKGKMDLVIGMAGEKTIFKGNGITEGNFIVIADQTGKYLVSVDAKKAAGYLMVRKPTNKKSSII